MHLKFLTLWGLGLTWPNTIVQFTLCTLFTVQFMQCTHMTGGVKMFNRSDSDFADNVWASNDNAWKQYGS